MPTRSACTVQRHSIYPHLQGFCPQSKSFSSQKNLDISLLNQNTKSTNLVRLNLLITNNRAHETSQIKPKKFVPSN